MADSKVPEGFMENTQGHLVPVDKVSVVDKLRDELVRTIAAKAEEMQKRLFDLKLDLLGEISAFVEQSASEYGVEIGGAKGNVSLVSYDGRIRVQRSIGNDLVFDERLQAAKALIDECLKDWTKDSGDEVKAIINNAFQVDKAGNISVGRILGLRRLEIADERWKQAMDAISDSVNVVGTRTYVRVHTREEPDQKWEHVAVDMAKV